MFKVCFVCKKMTDFGKSRASTCLSCIKSGYKWCARCSTIKSLNEFSKSGQGFMNICKVCHNKRNKKWRHTLEGNRKANSSLRLYRADELNRQKHVLRNQQHKAAGNMSYEQWYDTCIAFDFKCAYCGCEDKLTVEHVLSVSRGGKTSIGNIIPACQSCNSSKGNKELIKWYTSQVFYSKDRLESILKFIKGGKVNE